MQNPISGTQPLLTTDTMFKASMLAAWLLGISVSFYLLTQLCPPCLRLTLQLDLTGKNSSAVSNHTVCTHRLFRSYYEESGYFPGTGHWVDDSDDVTNNNAFHPNLCYFRWTDIPNEALDTCFRHMEIDDVLIMGDSNAGQYVKAALRKLRRVYGSCPMTSSQVLDEFGFNPAKYYFPYFSRIYTCRSTSQRSVLLRHISMNDVIDHEVPVSVNNSLVQAKRRKLWLYRNRTAIQTFGSYQDYVFRSHIKANPDLLLVFLPFNHMKKVTTGELRTELTQLKHLIWQTLGDRTKVFWIPAFREYYQKHLPWRKASEDKRQRGELGTRTIDAMNHVLFDVMASDIQNASLNRFGFMDLIQVSRDRHDWSRDGIHMHKIWYHRILSYFFQLLCST